MLTKKQQAALKIGDLVLWSDNLYKVRGFVPSHSLCCLTGLDPESFQFIEPAITSKHLKIPPPARVLAYKLSC